MSSNLRRVAASGLAGVAATVLIAASAGATSSSSSSTEESDWAIYEVGTNDVLLTSDDAAATSSAAGSATTVSDPASPGTGEPIEGAQTVPAPSWITSWQASTATAESAAPSLVDGQETTDLSNPLAPRVVVGGDDRVAADVTQAPYSQVVAIEATNGTDFWTCTGYLYGPDDVATAGHCIDASTDTPLIEGRIYLQLDSASPGDPVEICTIDSYAVNGRWLDDRDRGWDYAALQIGCNAGESLGSFGTINNEDIDGDYEATGYPGTPPEGIYGTQWTATGPFVNELSRILETNVDFTSGQSGGPVWTVDPEAGNAAVGIISFEYEDPEDYANGAVHIGTGAFGDLMDWKAA